MYSEIRSEMKKQLMYEPDVLGINVTYKNTIKAFYEKFGGA